MEPPLRVAAVGPRARLLYILAYWADRELQHREWILRERREPFVNALSVHIGFLYDAIDVTPPLDDAVGGIIASIGEVRRLEALDAALSRLWAVKTVNDDRPETFFDLPEWHYVSTLAQNVVNLFLMNGGAWDDSEPTMIDDDHLVAEFSVRGLAAQCLASIADSAHSTSTEQPPLRREFDEATTILDERCSLADPRAAIGRIYRDGDEIPRLEHLRDAVQAGVARDQIADLAGRALTALVHAWSGCNYDGPIDTTHSSR